MAEAQFFTSPDVERKLSYYRGLPHHWFFLQDDSGMVQPFSGHSDEQGNMI